MLKDEILKLLEESRGNVISGQEIAGRYGVSRNAVWKAVQSLRQSGYDILSAKSGGYYLSGDSDKMSAAGIRAYLRSEVPVQIIYTDSIDSTNNEAKRRLMDGQEGPLLIVADHQTGGRGRLGRRFWSPENAGIYMSLLYKIPGGVRSPMLITMAAGVAVTRAVEEMTDIRPGLKWVNDIYIGDLKAGGILTEAVTDMETGLSENVIVGIGLNVKQTEIPDELKGIVTSLNAEGLSRSRLAAGILDQLLKLYSDMDEDSFMDEYIAHSIVAGRAIRYEMDGVKLTGKVIEVERNGSLHVKRDDTGEDDHIFTGEIIFHEHV